MKVKGYKDVTSGANARNECDIEHSESVAFLGVCVCVATMKMGVEP
jgi:hypothetical protein